MRKQYRLNDAQFKTLMDACRPTPAMWGSGGAPLFSTPQENANRVWKDLGNEMGFVWNSCRDAGTGDQRDFTAEPILEPPIATLETKKGNHEIT